MALISHPARVDLIPCHEALRFESAEAANAVADAPEQDARYRRLVNLTEQEPVFTDCDTEWRIR